MPPSWPSRLLSASTASSQNQSATSPSQQLNKPLPANPPASHLSPNRNPSLPVRTSSSASPQHTHNRSASHPLPRIFSKKKSTQNFGGIGDLNAQVDDTLVPVLDEAQFTSSPTRASSGKRRFEDDPNAARHCMCCHSRVRFPKELKVFRCTTCLTINDLEPVLSNKENERTGQGERESRSAHLLGPKLVLPLSIERTRAIIDKCVLEHLTARCKRDEDKESKLQGLPEESVPEHKQVGGELKASDRRADSKSSIPSARGTPSDASSSAQVSTPSFQTSSATIRDFTDFDQFCFAESFDGSRNPSTPPAPPPKSMSSPAKQSSPHTLTSPTKQRPPGTAAPRTSPIIRKPVPIQPSRQPPPPPIQTVSSAGKPHLQRHVTPPGPPPRRTSESAMHRAREEQDRYERVKKIFRPLEEYILDSYGDFECLNSSFSTARPKVSARTHSESAIRTPPPEMVDGAVPSSVAAIDAKTLLLGSVAENGDWWTGRLERTDSDHMERRKQKESGKKGLVTSKSPQMNWTELESWHEIVHTAGQSWWQKLDELKSSTSNSISDNLRGPRNAQEIDADIADAREHAERSLLKITEGLLKRPKRPLTEPEDVRFLVIVLSNPSLYPRHMRGMAQVCKNRPDLGRRGSSALHLDVDRNGKPLPSPPRSPASASRDPGQHNGILKRIFGLLANSSDKCHRYLIGWFSRLPEPRFTDLIDLVASFVTYRLSKRRSRPRSSSQPRDGGLIPDLSGSARQTSAQLHLATGLSGGTKKQDDSMQSVADYSEDWQLRAASKLMALLFAANNSWQNTDAQLADGTSIALRPHPKTHGQLLPTSDFYNTMLDYHDLVADFKAWEAKRAKFTFCQYPFFLSMGSKIKVLEYDARRQMENKAREAYFDQVVSRRTIDVHLVLRVRRDCMVDDSLRQISEAVGAGAEDLKKGLRIQFTGEEGVDAGGLRKEWFLMLVREIFDPDHGMFLYDDDSHTCYFNPNSFETSDQYYLVGALLGLAIYNSTILDVALPPFAFRKLLAATPASASNSALPTIGGKGTMTYTIDDLAEYRPALAAGLQKLLDFDGDVESVFCRDFVAPVERYGTTVDIPLCAGGEQKAVTNDNRQEFVDLYVRYLLDVSVARQFEPFKRGFFTVCAGNALSLFRPEEIELLVRGSDEALNVDSLKAVAVYEGWKATTPPHTLLATPAETVPVIGWFWDIFRNADPQDQRKLLSFITSSDRIPAVGATNLILRIVAGGDGAGKQEAESATERFPVARTCFNMLVLWRYESRAKLEEKLWRAVLESEGFGLK